MKSSEGMSMNFMQMALEEARLAASRGEIPVGAVAVDHRLGQIVARACNEMGARKDASAHAEMLLIKRVLEVNGSDRFYESIDVYVTLEPCPMCAQALAIMRPRRIYFGAYDPKSGGIDHGAKIFGASSCHFHPEIIGSLYEQECNALLIDFFKKIRQK